MQHSLKGLEFRDARVGESKKGRRMNKVGKEIGDEGSNSRENKQVNSKRRKDDDEEAGRKEQTKQINDREALKKQRKEKGEHEKWYN
jgi:hypothetical protein